MPKSEFTQLIRQTLDAWQLERLPRRWAPRNDENFTAIYLLSHA